MIQESIVLGHRVFRKRIEVNKEKIEVFDKLPPLTSVKGIKSFLGHDKFYRKFINDFSKISKHLYFLLEHDRTSIFIRIA